MTKELIRLKIIEKIEELEFKKATLELKDPKYIDKLKGLKKMISMYEEELVKIK